MAHAARLGALTDDLITAITASTPRQDARQLKQFKDSALKIFKTHQHVRVNQFDIDARLEGLLEKFVVLNNEPLAHALKPRLDELASTPSKWRPEVLALLLGLSDRPAEKTDINAALEVFPEEPVTQLTWADIIADDPLTEEGIWDDVEIESDYSEHRAPSLSDLSDAEHTTSTQASSIGEDDVATFARAFIVPKDTQTLDRVKSLRYRMTSLQTDSQLSELQVTRQVLSMLQGLPSDLFDTSTDGQIRIASQCRIRDIAPSTLNRVLQSFASLGSQTSMVRKFVASAQESVVLQSFQAAVEDQLRRLGKTLSNIEQGLLDENPTVVSLMAVYAEIDRASGQLIRLASLIPDGTLRHNARALQLLNCLFEEACSLQLVGEEAEFSAVARLFFACLDPYLRPVKLWMTEGKIRASDQLFFVKSDSQNTDRGSIWHSRFALLKNDDGTVAVPSFMQSIAERIFRTGKSVIFLETLGQSTEDSRSKAIHSGLDADRIIGSMDNSLLPFSEIFKVALATWADHLEGPEVQVLPQMLMYQCGLQTTIEAVDHLYFGRNGASFQDFAYSVFTRVDRGDGWDDRFLLTELAHAAFESITAVDTNHISVRARPRKSQDIEASNKQRPDLLGQIVLDYSIIWALQNILTKETLATCQQAFTLLLRLYRAQYLLNQQEWTLSIMGGHANESKVKELLALRQRLAWFAGIFRNHVSDMLSLATEQLTTDLTAATDVDGMAAAFDKFRLNIASKLLLQTNLEPIHRSLISIFDVFEDVAIEWRNTIKQISDHTSKATPRQLAVRQGYSSRRRPTELDDTADLSADDDEIDSGKYNQRSAMGVPSLLKEYHRQLSFILAGLRGVSRVGGEPSWIMLSEKLQWGHEVSDRR